MAFEFLHLNSFSGLNFGGFCMPQLFSMPMTFSMPALPQISLFSFPTPFAAQPANDPENNEKSLLKEDIYNMLYPQKAGTRFDSNNFMNFNITNTFTPFNYTQPTIDTSFLTSGNKTRSSARTYYTLQPKTTTTLEEVNKIYNAEKGKKLAEKTIDGLKTSQNGYCARAVKQGISNAGLGSYQSGDADQMPSILSTNENFKEVKIAASDLDKLPAGCIICYAPGECNYDSRYGHVETTDGNGNAISFFVNNNIKESDNVRVFVPV